MPTDELIAAMVFALIGCFTPGPNNTIATVTGANFGWRAVLPHIAGVPVGFASMLLAAAGGVATLLIASPIAMGTLQWAGVAYLLWLSWALARARELAPKAVGGPFTLPLNFTQSALFQYFNPKAWMLALATAGAYFTGARPLQRGVIVSLVFAAAAVASLVVWAWLGASLRAWLAQGTRLRRFNQTMGAILATTAVWMALR